MIYGQFHQEEEQKEVQQDFSHKFLNLKSTDPIPSVIENHLRAFDQTSSKKQIDHIVEEASKDKNCSKILKDHILNRDAQVTKKSVDFPDEEVFDNCPTDNHDSQASEHFTQFTKVTESEVRNIEYSENIDIPFSEQISLYNEIEICKNDSSKLQKYDAFTDQDDIVTDS